MGDVITQSGMDFAADNAFHIEESPLYKSAGDRVRTVEFIRIIGNRLLFIEAKTTFANPDNPAGGNFIRFESEIDQICEKFIHSLNMYSSVKVGVADNPFPERFMPPEKISIVFVLVIKNHEIEWCKPIYAKLVETLPLYLKKIWKPHVIVMNHEIAMKWNLVVSCADTPHTGF